MCYNPYQLKELHPYTGEPQHVPCGKCPECKARIISGWSFRLMQEERVSTAAYFVTLTYDTHAVPFAPSGYMTLNKADVQKFMKRLRKRSTGEKPLKYFAVGEYGTKGWRPHYHLILFNAQPADIVYAWSLDGKPIGNVHFGQVSEASVGYTLKYIMKEGRIPLHRNDDRVPEFRIMSKGLGLSYISMEIIKWHHADLLNRMYLPLKDGKKIAMPRYYKDWIYLDPFERQSIADHLVKETQLRQEEFLAAMHARYGEHATSIIRQNQVAASKKIQADAAKRKDL